MRNRIFLLIGLLVFINTAFSQTTEFTYQGSLKDGPSNANANYDFEFRLFAAVSGGSSLGTLQRLNVPVSNGTFKVALDFGSQFPGTNRFLEIAVRSAGSGSFQLLSPRQPVSSTPYSVRSLTAANTDSLGGVAASQYVLTTDPRMTDARPPIAGSDNYIRNSQIQQTGSFNIQGQGRVAGLLTASTFTAGEVNTLTQYNINGDRILANPGSENLFAGAGAGASNTTGIENAFFGRFAGNLNNTGSGNSFFGFGAGRLTTNGTNNSIFGSRAGLTNSGNFNSFFGHRAGEANNGSVNSFYGTGAGLSNNSGASNTFIGHDAGNTNSSGSFNTVLGENSDVGATNLTNATAIGSKALVTQSNSLVLGSVNGTNGATADTNVGIGTAAPTARLHVSGSGVVRARINSDSNGGVGFTLNEQGRWSVAVVSPGHLTFFNDANAQLSMWLSAFDSSVNITTLNVSGIASLPSLGNAGATALCRNASNQISTCSSSIRYKNSVNNFGSGIDLIRQLRPVTFNWKADNIEDLGLVAEEVAEVEPLLVTRNDKGEVEGVKYDRVGVMLINAVKEQQNQIELQEQKIEGQQREIEELKKIVCSLATASGVCGKQ